jgi:hypothetical protein
MQKRNRLLVVIVHLLLAAAVCLIAGLTAGTSSVLLYSCAACVLLGAMLDFSMGRDKS